MGLRIKSIVEPICGGPWLLDWEFVLSLWTMGSHPDLSRQVAQSWLSGASRAQAEDTSMPPWRPDSVDKGRKAPGSQQWMTPLDLGFQNMPHQRSQSPY